MEENQMPQEHQATSPMTERPTGLIICLVLSLCSSLFGILSGIGMWVVSARMTAVSPDEMDEKMEDMINAFGMSSMHDQLLVTLESLVQYGQVLGLINLLVSVVTIVAVVMMFRYQKLGFHLYTGARVIEVFLPALIAGAAFFSLFTVLTSVFFGYFYSRFLKLMR